jgi:hypothetical protein
LVAGHHLLLRVEDRLAQVALVGEDLLAGGELDLTAVETLRAWLSLVWQVTQPISVNSFSPAAGSEPSAAPPSHVWKSLGSITTTLPIIAECLVPQYSAQNKWNSPVLVASNQSVV